MITEKLTGHTIYLKHLPAAAIVVAKETIHREMADSLFEFFYSNQHDYYKVSFREEEYPAMGSIGSEHFIEYTMTCRISTAFE